MFDLQQNIQKPISQEAKPGNKFIQDTTVLHKTGCRWNRKC